MTMLFEDKMWQCINHCGRQYLSLMEEGDGCESKIDSFVNEYFTFYCEPDPNISNAFSTAECAHIVMLLSSLPEEEMWFVKNQMPELSDKEKGSHFIKLWAFVLFKEQAIACASENYYA